MQIKIKNHFIDVEKVPKHKHWLGLMFSRRQKAKNLLFEFQKPTKLKIHSFFVFFPFIAIWLDKNNKIIQIKKINPFKLSIEPKKPFLKLIEIPINQKNQEIVGFLDEDERFK